MYQSAGRRVDRGYVEASQRCTGFVNSLYIGYLAGNGQTKGYLKIGSTRFQVAFS